MAVLSKRCKGIKKAAFSTFAVAFFIALSCQAFAVEAVQLQEGKIKAGLVYNFLKYTSWPDNNLGKIRICLYGGDSFEGALYPLSGRTAQQQVIDVREISDINDSMDCEMVFINKAYEDEMADVLSVLDNTNVMTLSDIKNFSHKGGMVEFSKEKDQRIHLVMNKTTIDRSGLVIGDRLLKLARVVQ